VGRSTAGRAVDGEQRARSEHDGYAESRSAGCHPV